MCYLLRACEPLVKEGNSRGNISQIPLGTAGLCMELTPSYSLGSRFTPPSHIMCREPHCTALWCNVVMCSEAQCNTEHSSAVQCNVVQGSAQQSGNKRGQTVTLLMHWRLDFKIP